MKASDYLKNQIEEYTKLLEEQPDNNYIQVLLVEAKNRLNRLINQ